MTNTLRALALVATAAADELEKKDRQIDDLVALLSTQTDLLELARLELDAATRKDAPRKDAPLCLAPHPEHGMNRPCGVELGHMGVHESEDPDSDLPSLWWCDPTDTLDPELPAVDALLRAAGIDPDTCVDQVLALVAEGLKPDGEPATGLPADAASCLSTHPEGSPLSCELEKGHDGLHEASDPEDDGEVCRWRDPPSQPDGEPDLSDCPPPQGPPSDGMDEEKQDPPLMRFRKLLRARLRDHVLNTPTPPDRTRHQRGQEIYQAVKLAWYGDVTFADSPKKGKAQVPTAFYLPDARDSVAEAMHVQGSLAWLKTASDEVFKAAVNAALKAE